MPNNQKVIQDLLSKRVIGQADVGVLKELSGTMEIFDFLSKDRKIDQEKLAKFKAEYYHLKYIDLTGVKVDKEILNIIPKDLAENYQLVFFEKKDDVLKTAILDPTNLKALEVVEFIAREKDLKIAYYLVSPNSFNQIFKQYTALKLEVEKALDVARGKMEEHKEKAKALSEQEVEEVVKSAPISKMVEVIIQHGVEGYASDIHIEPFVEQTRVRYRVDGILQTTLVLPKAVHAAIVSRIKVLANLKIDETRVPQDGRIRLKFSGKDVDFRISTLPLYDQEKVVMRILDTGGGALTLDQLGFEGRNFEIIQNNIKKPNGMFLVTGPTGSGKSTTLYSVLNILNQEGVNIVTLEDPVEYYLKGVNQSQINPDVGLTFATGLRSILRQDPDIVMVGEIRDNETAELAIHAALTGHIVLSTLHTNDSFGAIPRLIDMHVEPFLLTSTLNVIIAQRLVRKICDKCKIEYDIPQNLVDFVWTEYQKIPKESLLSELQGIKDKKSLKFYHGKGCSRCNNLGYSGRIAVAEVLDMTNDLRKMISSGEPLEKIKQEVILRRMSSLQQDGIMKALKGMTTIEEVMRVTKE